jgi:hypothetical protein
MLGPARAEQLILVARTNTDVRSDVYRRPLQYGVDNGAPLGNSPVPLGGSIRARQHLTPRCPCSINPPNPASSSRGPSSEGRGYMWHSPRSEEHVQVGVRYAHAYSCSCNIVEAILPRSRGRSSSCPYSRFAQGLSEWCYCSLSSWHPYRQETAIRSSCQSAKRFQYLQRLSR